MTLSNSAKFLIMDSMQLHDYCIKNNINKSKLQQCRIDKYGNQYGFMLAKDGSEKLSRSMENDIATQPEPVLIMSLSDRGMHFEFTKHTKRIQNS